MTICFTCALVEMNFRGNREPQHSRGVCATLSDKGKLYKMLPRKKKSTSPEDT